MLQLLASRIAVLALMLLSATTAFAHPGPPHTHVTAAQMIAEPQGAVWFLALGFTVIACVVRWRRGFEA